MSTHGVMMATADVLSDEQLLDILENRIPALVERRPDLWRRIYSAWVDTFARREEIAAIMEELRRLDSNLTAFQESVNDRFNHVDERLAGVDERLVGLSQEVSDTRDWFQLTVGRLQTRAGRNLEDVVAGALRIGLRRPDVRADMIKLRQKIVDREGMVYKPGKQKEVDLVASNGEYLAFEVKSAAEPDDVDDFAEKVALLQHLHPEKQVRGVFITLAPEADVQQRCQALGIELAPAPAKS